jgi:para-nitrobenzyl esterase
MDPRLETRSGVLRGSAEKGLAVFRGVRFAAPPRGRLRFRPPEAESPWTGEREATQFGPAPPQNPDPIGARLGLAAETTDEDCLTLNLWTPALDAARRPVMVWIPGGAFITGSAAAPLYDGARLARRGDVVVVTLQYRVGALGFAMLPGAVNLGLRDQLAALEWVHEHASALGGDPENVTLFGESAGAGSVVALLAMPAARGRFQRAIVQSAAPDGMIARDDAEARAAVLLANLGVHAEDRAGLERIPVEAILSAQRSAASERPWKTGMYCAPVIDGEHLPRRPLDAIASGSAAGIDLLIGTNQDEMNLYAVGSDLSAMSDALVDQIFAAQISGNAADGRTHAAQILEAYRALHPEKLPSQIFALVQAELSMRIPSILLAESQGRQGGRVSMYLFSWPSPLEKGRIGACHALDLPFTFGNLDAPGMAEFAGEGARAEELSAAIINAWTAFARSGDPSHPSVGAWPAYDADRRATMELGTERRVLDAPLESQRALWDRLGSVA